MVLFILLTLSLLNAPVNSVNDEGKALLSFKHSLQNVPQSVLTNWTQTDKTPCNWPSITCIQERVVTISLQNSRLAGSLNPSLANLTSLRRINLRNNNFSGELPSQIFKRAKSLQSLVLSENSFSGSIPNEIGSLTGLQTLDLSQNLMTGSLPESLITCTRLKSLNLAENRFTGLIPEGLGNNLKSLQSMNISFNRFRGSIPSDMGNMSSLAKALDISHNFLSGPIPESLGNLPAYAYIDMSYNNLTGSIPSVGVLVGLGPMAFAGNPSLCGPPLKIPCTLNSTAPSSSSQNPSYPKLPESNTQPAKSNTEKNGSGSSSLSASVIIGIALGTAIGICIASLLLAYGRRKFRGVKSVCNVENETFSSCFGREKDDKDRREFVRLDAKASFDLDELLQASAFVLGKSRVGILYKVKIANGSILVVRRLGEGCRNRFKDFQAEVEAIGRVRHTNIVTLRAYFWSDDEKLLIYDYVPNGDLATAIHGTGGSGVMAAPLMWHARLGILKGVSKGLSYLHEVSPKKYVHGDLKPNNILLAANMTPLISDFGLGRLAQNGPVEIIPGSSITYTGTSPSAHNSLNNQTSLIGGCSPVSSGTQFYYSAPESINSTTKPLQKWDVFSFGVILLEVISGRMPMTQTMGSSGMDLARWIQVCMDENKPLEYILDPPLARELHKEDGKVEEQIVTVLKIGLACCNEIPERRPTTRQISDALHKLTKPAN